MPIPGALLHIRLKNTVLKDYATACFIESIRDHKRQTYDYFSSLVSDSIHISLYHCTALLDFTLPKATLQTLLL